MSYRTKLLIGIFFAVAPLAFSQGPALTPSVPEDAFTTRDLIAWSWLQKPQPVPQPLPPPDTPIPQPDQSQAKPSNTPGPAHDESAPTQSFVGRIVKDGGQYVLRVASSTTYQLEGEGDVKQYENQNVRITGSLNKDRSTIHVAKIELLS